MPRFQTRKIRRTRARRQTRRMRRGASRAGGMVVRRSGGALGGFIRRVLRQQAETKYVANNFDALGNQLGAPWFVQPIPVNINYCNPAIPKLTQGDDDYQREGNVIQPTGCSVSLKIGFNGTDLSANSIIGVVYYGTVKNAKTWASGQNPVNSLAWLDRGDGTNNSWAGLREQLSYPLDKKQYNLKRIVFRLSKTPGVQNQDVVPAAVGGAYAGGFGMLEKSILLKFKAPKKLYYNLGTDTYPQNFAPFYMVSFCHADGSPVAVGEDRQLVNCTSRTHMWFKDV